MTTLANIVLASMRHAAREVLGAEPADELLMAAVGGPGLEAQMQALAPGHVEELVNVYRAHNEPLHEEQLSVRAQDRSHQERGLAATKRREDIDADLAGAEERPTAAVTNGDAILEQNIANV